MAALRLRKIEPLDDPAGFGRVVVLDRSLQALAQRLGLAQLPAKPATKADLGRPAYRLRAQTRSLRSTVNPQRS